MKSIILFLILTMSINFSYGAKKMTKVLMKTNKGDVEIELNAEKAPISVKNFLSYVEKKFYDGLIFHRVIPTFMIQGGGFDSSMTQKAPDAPIKNEANNGLSNLNGTLAMARTNVTDSATSQFFINVKDNTFLDYQSDANYGYAVFGSVTKGMDVVNTIKAVSTTNTGGHGDVPVEAVVIESIRVIE